MTTKTHLQITQSYSCIYPLQQHKHKHKGSYPDPQSYRSSYTVNHHKKAHVDIITSITCVNNLYNITNMNVKDHFQNAQS